MAASTKLTVRTPHLGRRIQLARLAIRPEMTQADLAQELGVQANNVSRLERGLVNPPSKAYPILCRVLKKPRDYFVNEPLSETDAPTAVTVERDDSFTGLPNLRALMMTTDWRDASKEARALVLDEANRSGGDLPIEEWAAELRRAKRRAPGDTATRDALGRAVGEADVVEDEDD